MPTIDGIVVDEQTIDTIVMPNGEEISVGGVTPTGNKNITSAGVTDVAQYATATVAEAELNTIIPTSSDITWYFNALGSVTASYNDDESINFVGAPGFVDRNSTVTINAHRSADYNLPLYQGANTVVPSANDQTLPTEYRWMRNDITVKGIKLQSRTVGVSESAQTITPDSGYVGLSEVNVAGINSNYVGSSIPRRSSSDLTANGATVTAPNGYYVYSASLSIPSGTEGTPTVTKGTVTNHSVTVTPSVTNSAGYISGGAHNGTAVTVSASELVSGSQTLSDNGTYDVTNLAEVVVDVQGGGGGGTQVATKTSTPSTASSSIQFTGLSGNPTSFVVTSQADIATNTNGVTAVVFDGSSLHGQTMTTQVTADTGFTKSYSNGTLTITATSAYFEANAYKLVYTYGGSTSDIETADVQVGSGATSITFPVNGRPAYWSCIFKSDFSTSSGYQRVIAVANDGSSTYGLAMDSVANAQTSWTASYSGGNFTINSQGTNNGGYFHQPGYYQLTYYVDPSAPSYQSKTVTPTTATQNVTPDSGYDALSQVTVNPIPSQYIVPTGNLAITQNGNNINVSQYATVSVNVSGGGSSVQYDTKTVTASNYPTSLQFTGMLGEPKAFVLRLNAAVSSSGSTTYYYIVDISHFGTTTHGNCFRIGSTRRVDNITSGYSYSYSGTTLTITSSASSRSSSPGAFYNGSYELLYAY